MEVRDLVGHRPAKLQAKEVRKKLVVAKPCALRVERHDERVGVLESQQHLLRTRPACQQVGELTAHPVDERGSQEHALNVARLTFEHLGHEVLPDRPVGAGELGHEALGIRMAAEGDHGKAQAGRPAFGALVQRDRPGVGQADARRGQQLARLALGEPEIAGPDLGDLVGKSEPVQPDRRIPARRQHEACRAREPRKEMLELREGVGRLQLVEIIDDQHDRLDPLGDLRHERVHRLVAVGCGGRRSSRLRLERARRAADRVQDGTPEPLRMLFVAVDGDERDTTTVGRTVSPRTQQRGLPTARRRRDDGHAPAHGAVQQLEEITAIEQTSGDRDVARHRVLRALPALCAPGGAHADAPLWLRGGPDDARRLQRSRPFLAPDTPTWPIVMILSGGSYGSPAILLRSGLGPAADLAELGLDVVADLPVGQRLQDQPLYYNAYALKTDALDMRPAVGALLWTQSSVARGDELDMHVAVTHLMPPEYSPTGGAIALSVAVVKPDSRGTLTLRSRDPHEQPEIDCNCLAEDRDARRMLEGVKLTRRIGRNPALAQFLELEILPGDTVGDDQLGDAIASNLASYGHPTATAPMGGPQDPWAVVDSCCAVRGIDALRVVDASIIPAVPSVAINPTTIMLAERIAKTVYTSEGHHDARRHAHA